MNISTMFYLKKKYKNFIFHFMGVHFQAKMYSDTASKQSNWLINQYQTDKDLN